MKLLYLSEDFAYTPVHRYICDALISSSNNIDITAFSIQRNRNLTIKEFPIQKEHFNFLLEEQAHSKLLYKFDFSYKIKIKYSSLKNCCDISNFDYCFASTLFSEGAMAYKIYKDFGLPYTVAIRGTDVNFYLKKMPHLWKLAYKILLNASHIIFITASLKQTFFQHIYFSSKFKSLDQKASIIPNGIDNYWIENKWELRKKASSPFYFIFIGRLDKNKNIKKVIKSIINLNKIQPTHLKIIGGKGCYSNYVKSIIQKYPKLFSYVGEIYDKTTIKDLLRESNAFIMTSHSETFGLVYIEALSQGLPVIYSENQGIHGTFKDKKIGEAVCPSKEQSIFNGMKQVINNYKDYDLIGNDLYNFQWENIGKKISKIICH